MSKIKFLPKQLINDFKLNQTYPLNQRTGFFVKKSYFNDENVISFKNNETISLPTTLNNKQLNVLGGFGFQTDIEIIGKTNQDAANYPINLLLNNKENISPFTEDDSLHQNFFYEEGTTFLIDKLKDKDIIKIKLPIPKNEYFTGDPNSTELLALSPGTFFDDINQNAGWIKTSLNLLDEEKNLHFKNSFTDPFGNIVNHNLNLESNYNEFIHEITSQSLNRESPNDNLKIKLSDYINKPFVAEKVLISFYGTPSTTWLNSKTRLNKVADDVYTMSGSAITAILAATNSGYYKTLFTGTIVSNFDSKNQVIEQLEGEFPEVFPIGFDRWATPTVKINNDSLNRIMLKGNCGFSNGAVQYVRSDSYLDFVKTISLSDGHIYSTKKIGRTNSGFNSGYSKFANEYSYSNDPITSTLDEEGILTILGEGYYNHLFNNFKTYESPCVLKPQDSLIFTLSKYVGEENDSFIIGGTEIEPEETENGYQYKNLNETHYITITIYGSYLKQEKETHDLYQENLNTNCVHEIIGDEIITDEWDCNPSNSLFGSLINNSKIQKSDFINEFLQISPNVNINLLNNLKWNSINSYETDTNKILENKKLFKLGSGELLYSFYQESILSSSFSELKNKLKYVQTYNNNEYYYDSLTPSFNDILITENKKILNLKFFGTGNKIYDGIIFISNSSVIDAFSSNFNLSKTFILENWQFKFPFDDEFKNCRRLFNEKILLEKSDGQFTKNNNSVYTRSTERILNTDLNLLVSIINNSEYTDYIKTYCDNLITSLDNSPGSRLTTGLSYRDYKKVIFGTTSGNGLVDSPGRKQDYLYTLYDNNLHYTHYVDSSGNQNTNPNSYSVPNILKMCIAPIIRGWKYGLYSGVETQTKMHWSMKRYGQFRDLIEQRHFTRFYYLNEKKNNIKGGVLSGISISPISIIFVNPLTLEQVEPNITDSANLTDDASSVRPYFDGEYRDRTYKNYLNNNPVVYVSNTLKQI